MCLGAYAYFYQAGGWNQNSRFDLVRAISEKGTFQIDSYVHNTGDNAEKDGHYYCDKAPGVSWLAVPPYWIIHQVAGSDQPSPRYLAVSSYLVTVWTVGLPSAISVVMLYWLLAAFGLAAVTRATFALAYGLATLAFPYATLLNGHQLGAALLLTAFALLVRARHMETERPGPWRLAVVGSILGMAVVVEYQSFLAVAVLCAYALLFVRPWRRLLFLAAGLALPGICLALYHMVVFGDPFTVPYEFSTQEHRHMGFMGLGVPSPEALWGITFSSYRGLFYTTPWLLLAVPGTLLLALRRRFRPEAIACSIIALLYVYLNVSLVDWVGGWAMGPRYLVPAIPFMVVAAAGVAVAWPSLRLARAKISAWPIFFALLGTAAFCMLTGVAVMPEVPDCYLLPYQHFLFPAFCAGELGVNTQSIDMINSPMEGTLYAWNLGQKIGLSGLASLAPLGLFLAAAGGWLAWSLRRRPLSP